MRRPDTICIENDCICAKGIAKKGTNAINGVSINNIMRLSIKWHKKKICATEFSHMISWQ
jgi:hypothetical protein